MENTFQLDFSKIFTIQNVIIYIVLINIIAFGAMYWDKKRAIKGKYIIAFSFIRWRHWCNSWNVYF